MVSCSWLWSNPRQKRLKEGVIWIHVSEDPVQLGKHGETVQSRHGRLGSRRQCLFAAFIPHPLYFTHTEPLSMTGCHLQSGWGLQLIHSENIVLGTQEVSLTVS